MTKIRVDVFSLGVHFGMVSVSDLILLDHDGQVVGGNTSRPANAAGFLIHSGLHRRYPHVNAACHTHSPNGKAWSTFAKPLDMINQDVTMFYDKALGVYEEFGGVVLDPGESERLADALGPQGKGLVLRNHGLLTVGTTVDEAAYLFTLLERSCEIQLKVDAAAALGTPKRIIDDEAAEYTFRMTSDPVSRAASASKTFSVLSQVTRKRCTTNFSQTSSSRKRYLEGTSSRDKYPSQAEKLHLLRSA